MKTPYLLHMFNSTKNVSPFDVNMAYEANFDGVIPYSEVTLDDIYTLTQDTIFSRGKAGIKNTGIFIGGRELGLAIDMYNRAKSAMIPPFEVSVFVDPSGAITTAAALVACIEVQLKREWNESLSGKRVDIISGTGPVGICAAVLTVNCGATVYVSSHKGIDIADKIISEYNRRFNVTISVADCSTQEKLSETLSQSDVVIGTAKAGVQIISGQQLEQASNLLVAADINAVPPLGIEGIGTYDKNKKLVATPKEAIGIGALAVGDIKYKVHTRILEIMKHTEKPIYIDHEEALKIARECAIRL